MIELHQAADTLEASPEEKWDILTIQPRVAVGSLCFAEIPARMLEDGTFVGTAARERNVG
jgi:ADP-sugar diphosphatase